MSELGKKALLPAGVRDILPPAAAFEADIVERLIAHFAGWGYQRVKAPLVEFEEGLLSGAGRVVAGDTFRLMDPLSQRMMGVRADITTQMARIALTRLRRAPRPLRLSYSGEVLRVTGTQLRPERQFAQVGVELVGAASPEADAEMIALATDALAALGVPEMSVDITVPPLVPALFDYYGVAPERREELRAALDHKDLAAVKRLGGALAPILVRLLNAAGPAAACYDSLEALDLEGSAAAERARLGAVLERLARLPRPLGLTIDPVENRGFEYHTGIAFTIFPLGARGELGGGGRYLASLDGDSDAGGEPSTGFTLYVDTILRILRPPEPARAVLLPSDAPYDVAARLRDEGWVTVAALEPVADLAAEARRLECGYVLFGDAPRALEELSRDG